MKKSSLWILSALAAAVLIAGGARWMKQRDAAKAVTAAASAAAVPRIELANTDVYVVQLQSMNMGMAITGNLKASQSALVKARVAGELLDLSVREGDTVKAGQVLGHIDPSDYQARVRQAQQQADAAQAQVAIAQRQLDNNQALVAQGFISKTALLTSQANLDGAKANQMAAVAALDVAKKALADTTVRSPLAGQVAQRLAQPGERVAVEARIVEVVNLAQLELEAALPPSDAAQVRVGMTAQLHVEGLTEAITAKVMRINPSAQAGSRNVVVYLGMNGQDGLRQGLFAQGRLDIASPKLLAVPLTSVRTDKPQPYVQVIENQKVRHVTVQTGIRTAGDGQSWIAVQGLAEGAQVLNGGVGAVREGVQVSFTAVAK